MNDNFSIFLPIIKVDEEKRLVYLRAAQETPDRSGEIMDYDASKPNFEKWSAEQYEASMGKSYGNVRAMHDPKSATGIIAEPLSFDDLEKAIDAVVYVSDDGDWRKCKDGTFTGASIGGSYGATRLVKMEDGKSYKKYVAKPNHLALVDRPCIPTATFQLVKADGSTHVKTFKTNSEDSVMKHSAATTIAVIKAHGEEDGQLLLDGVSSEDLAKMDGAAQKDELAKIKARKDVKAEEGKEKYGDVKFADEKNKKYPIDTEEHVRAAWNYINKEKNAAKYGEEDLKNMKGKIVAAWKDKIDKDGSPSASEKSAPSGSLRKVDAAGVVGALKKCFGGNDMDWMATPEVFDVWKALSALSRISALIQQEKSEDHPEAAEQLQSLTDALLALKDFISSEIQEVHGIGASSAPTITMNRVDGTGDMLKIEIPGSEFDWEVPLEKIAGLPLAKIGAKHSAADMEKIQAIHDHTAALGAKCSTEKADVGGDLIKADQAAAMAKIDNALAKLATTQGDLAKAQSTIDGLAKRIKDMEDAPAEGKAVLRAVPVGKEEDGGRLGKTAAAPVSEDELAKLDAHDRRLVKEGGYTLDNLKKMNANDKALALIKLIQAEGAPADRPKGI